MTSTRAAAGLATLLVVLAVMAGFIGALILAPHEHLQQQHHYLPAGEIGSGITHVLPGGSR